MRLKPESIFSSIIVFAMALTMILFGCAKVSKKPDKESAMEEISSWSYPDFSDDLRYDGLEHSISKSLIYLNKIPADREFAFGQDRYTAGHMIESMQHFLEFIQDLPTAEELNGFIQANYRVYRSVGRDGWAAYGVAP